MMIGIKALTGSRQYQEEMIYFGSRTILVLVAGIIYPQPTDTK